MDNILEITWYSGGATIKTISGIIKIIIDVPINTIFSIFWEFSFISFISLFFNFSKYQGIHAEFIPEVTKSISPLSEFARL